MSAIGYNAVPFLLSFIMNLKTKTVVWHFSIHDYEKIHTGKEEKSAKSMQGSRFDPTICKEEESFVVYFESAQVPQTSGYTTENSSFIFQVKRAQTFQYFVKYLHV